MFMHAASAPCIRPLRRKGGKRGDPLTGLGCMDLVWVGRWVGKICNVGGVKRRKGKGERERERAEVKRT